MDHGSAARNAGPVALPPPPTTLFTTKGPVVYHHQQDVLDELAAGGVLSCGAQSAAAVQLVCTNPGCTVEPWMDVGDWEARVTSAQRAGQQQRGWNGDEDDWRPDHVTGVHGLSAGGGAGVFTQQLVCPCGRGYRRRATMPSTSSPARLDRLQQLRLMRRSEPMLAGVAPSYPASPYSHWPPFTATDAGLWSSRPAMLQPAQNRAHLGFCPQAQEVGVGELAPAAVGFTSTSRQRVLSEPETYDSTNTAHCTATDATNGYVYGLNSQQQQLLKPINGYHVPPPSLQLAPSSSSSTLDLCHAGELAGGGMYAASFQPDCVVDVVGRMQGLSVGQEGERHRNASSGLTPKRPTRPDVTATALNGEGVVASSRGARSGSSGRDGASPDSMSSDSGSSSGSGRRKPAAVSRATTVCSRGNIFRQRTPAELAVFRSLSLHCNAYEVQTAGDDAPYGKDRLRTHVLVALSAARRSTVDCVVCAAQLPVYHNFPLLDGLFFESPMRYNSDVRVEPLTIGGLHRQPLNDASKFYLNAVCFSCLQVLV